MDTEGGHFRICLNKKRTKHFHSARIACAYLEVQQKEGEIIGEIFFFFYVLLRTVIVSTPCDIF